MFKQFYALFYKPSSTTIHTTPYQSTLTDLSTSM